MNSQVSKSIFLLLLLAVVSCTKEKDIVYELEPVSVTQGGTGKNNLKSTSQFITIAWQDLFGSSIPQNEMAKMNTVYSAFGDKKILEDIIIRNLLNKPGIVIPQVSGDTSAFIEASYLKFYNRKPGVFESYYLLEQFRLNSALTPEVFYYSLMTSDEYRFY